MTVGCAHHELQVEGAHGPTRIVPTCCCDPTGNRGFREHKEVGFLLPDTGWALRIDDEDLQIVGSAGKCLARWSPNFFAGAVRAELADPAGVVRATYVLDVAPDDAKLGSEHFRELLDEIRAEDEALLLGHEPAWVRAGAAGHLPNVHVQYSRLRRHADQLAAALRAVSSRPVSVPRERRELVPLHRVRRIDSSTVLRALRSPDLLPGLTARGSFSAEHGDALRQLVDVPTTERHLDGAANRSLAHLVHRILHRTRWVRTTLAALVEREAPSDTTTALAPRWPHRREFLERLESALGRALECRPLCDVTRPETTSAGLNAISAHPLYARAYAVGWRMLRPGFAGTPEDDCVTEHPKPATCGHFKTGHPAAA